MSQLIDSPKSTYINTNCAYQYGSIMHFYSECTLQIGTSEELPVANVAPEELPLVEGKLTGTLEKLRSESVHLRGRSYEKWV